MEQSSWIPLTKPRKTPIKISEAMERANKLIEWYRLNKPEVTRCWVTKEDYKAFEEAVGTKGVTLTDEGVQYRGLLIAVAK
jgi:hypothetical protein